MPIHKMCLERYSPIFNSLGAQLNSYDKNELGQPEKCRNRDFILKFQKHRPLELQRDGPLVTRKRKRKEKPFADKYDHK